MKQLNNRRWVVVEIKYYFNKYEEVKRKYNTYYEAKRYYDSIMIPEYEKAKRFRIYEIEDNIYEKEED